MGSLSRMLISTVEENLPPHRPCIMTLCGVPKERVSVKVALRPQMGRFRREKDRMSKRHCCSAFLKSMSKMGLMIICYPGISMKPMPSCFFLHVLIGFTVDLLGIRTSMEDPFQSIDLLQLGYLILGFIERIQGKCKPQDKMIGRVLWGRPKHGSPKML